MYVFLKWSFTFRHDLDQWCSFKKSSILSFPGSTFRIMSDAKCILTACVSSLVHAILSYRTLRLMSSCSCHWWQVEGYPPKSPVRMLCSLQRTHQCRHVSFHRSKCSARTLCSLRRTRQYRNVSKSSVQMLRSLWLTRPCRHVSCHRPMSSAWTVCSRRMIFPWRQVSVHQPTHLLWKLHNILEQHLCRVDISPNEDMPICWTL